MLASDMVVYENCVEGGVWYDGPVIRYGAYYERFCIGVVSGLRRDCLELNLSLKA